MFVRAAGAVCKHTRACVFVRAAGAGLVAYHTWHLSVCLYDIYICKSVYAFVYTHARRDDEVYVLKYTHICATH